MPETTTHPRTILIVDDEDVIRELIVDVVSESGFRVLSAANGGAAVDIVRNERGGIDLVILDMHMPDMDGRRAFELMRAIDPGLRVLIATGYSRDDLVGPLMAMGIRGIVSKPFHVEDLLQLIQSHLRS